MSQYLIFFSFLVRCPGSCKKSHKFFGIVEYFLMSDYTQKLFSSLIMNASTRHTVSFFRCINSDSCRLMNLPSLMLSCWVKTTAVNKVSMSWKPPFWITYVLLVHPSCSRCITLLYSLPLANFQVLILRCFAVFYCYFDILVWMTRMYTDIKPFSVQYTKHAIQMRRVSMEVRLL